MRRLAPSALALLAIGGCVGEPSAAPCTADGRCVVGYQCVSERCEACGADCETSHITLLSTGGGLACDAEGTCVRFPPNSLGGPTEIEIARTNSPNDTIGAPPLSKVYAFRPTSVLPRRPVEVIFPVSRQVDQADGVTIQRAFDPRGPWESMPTRRDGTRASTFTDVLGFFALGRIPSSSSSDAGTTDGGPAAPTDPLPGIDGPRAFPSALTTLHGIAWEATTDRVLFCDRMTGAVLGFTHDETGVSVPAPVRSDAPGAYGVTTGPGGRVLVMELGERRITEQLAGAPPTSLVDRFQNLRFNGPVDAAIRADGTVYFTDPPTGLTLGGGARELPFSGLFRRAPSGTLVVEWQGPPTAEPRGVELSPDERRLYVSEHATDAVLVFDVRDDGSLTNRRPFVTPLGGGPDGLAVDQDGNVYVGTAGGIEVFAPDGRRWGGVEISEGIGSLAFAGPELRTLYATGASSLYVLSVTTPGTR